MKVELAPDEVNIIKRQLHSAIGNLKTYDQQRIDRGREPKFAQKIEVYYRLLRKLAD